MTKAELAEAIADLREVLEGLLSAARRPTIAAGATLRRAVGSLSTRTSTAIQTGTLGDDLLACFDAARKAGATIDGFAQLRAMIQAQAPVGWPAVAVNQACLRMALVEESLCLAALSLTSRADGDRYLARMNLAFDAAEEYAADLRSVDTYRAIVALHAAVSQDIAVRSRPLPRMVSYATPISRPALTVANRLYGDGARADELVAENKVVHPAFMPRTGRALSQ